MDILSLPAGRLRGLAPLAAEEMLVLRFGTVIQTAVSVRRPPASVLLASGGEHLGISHG